MTWDAIFGKCEEVLPTLPDNSVHTVVCDPPYGLKFMGKKWDYSLPSTVAWRECLRVLKPGGFLLAFSSSRTFHRMAVNIEDAGFVIHPMVGMLGWIQGQGFPKGRQVDGMEGYKYGLQALKPALEPICVAQKPYDGKPLDSMMKHEVGAFNIDGCRIPTAETITNHSRGSASAKSKGIYGDSSAQQTHVAPGQEHGRYPANVVMVHGPECGDDCQDGCPVKALGDQSGDCSSARSSGNMNNPKRGGNTTPSWGISDGSETHDFRDKGTEARFFSQFHHDEPPFYYCSKASTAERNAGLGERNPHPTVKPIKLMRWLIRLVSRDGQVVLDPFMGSGSTGIAALMERRDFIGIEMDPASFDTALKRIKHWEGELL